MIEKELGIVTQINTHQTKEENEPDYLNSKMIITPKFIRNIIATILVIACLAYLAWQINAIFSSPLLIIHQPEPDFITTDNFVTVEGETLPEINLTINDQKILTDQDGNFKTIIDLQTGLNTIEIEAKKKHGKANIEIRQVMLDGLEIIEGESPAKDENLIN